MKGSKKHSKSSKISVKHVLVAFAFIFLIAVIGFLLSESSGTPSSLSTYVVWYDGANYNIGGTFGSAVFSSSNLNTVLDNVISKSDLTITFTPNTIYNIDGCIVLQSDQHYKGYGATLNVVNVYPTSDSALFLNWNPIVGTSIEGFTLQMNANDNINQGIYLKNTENCIIQGNSIYNAKNRGISLDGHYGADDWGLNNQVLNNIVQKTYASVLGECIVLGGQKYGTVRGNIVSESFQGGITLSGSYQCTVTQNTISNSDGQNVGYGNIDLESSGNNNIVSNIMSGTGTGVRLSRDSQSNNVNNNNIQSSNYGIELIDSMGPASNNLFSYNEIVGSNVGIMVYSPTCVNNVFTGNKIANTVYSGIEDHGSHSTYSYGEIKDFNNGYAGIWLDGDYYNVNNVKIDGLNNFNVVGIRLNPALHSSITNNRINNCFQGISEDSGSDYNNVAGNTITGTTSGNNIIIVGPNTIRGTNTPMTG